MPGMATNNAKTEIQDNEGMTPLFYVKSIDAAKMLLEFGANIHAVNNRGESVVEYILKRIEAPSTPESERQKLQEVGPYLVERLSEFQKDSNEQYTPTADERTVEAETEPKDTTPEPQAIETPL